MRTAIPAPSRFARTCAPTAAFSCLAQIFAASVLIAALQFAAAPRLSAQPTVESTATHKPLRARHATKAVVPAPVIQAAPEPPPAPKPPDWPATNSPTEATVVWNSQGLRIDASNSSLSQILKEVSMITGVKVDGFGADQRIFGTYGPAPARDVLGQLLEGSNYNVLMIGDQGQGTPRQIVLTAQPHGSAPQVANNQAQNNDENANNDADDQQEQQPQPQQPPVMRNGFTPGAPPRTPQQIMQEMQQRQMQQMQQNSPQ